MGLARILFLSDTHLGFDMSFRPRIQRRRRGPDFFENFERALQPAREGRVDCVVHGGDILYRSKVPARLVDMAFGPLKRLADEGVPIFVVPGNHERSNIPYGLLAQHPRVFLFDRPKTYTLDLDGWSLALSGFPCVRNGVRKDFRRIVDETGWRKVRAQGHLLCMHQAVDGAMVGPSNYVFRYDQDVVRASDIPPGFAAVLSGHIHRFQVLTRDLRGRRLSAPVFYPGSIERTSFVEKDETKGYLTLDFETNTGDEMILRQWRFVELPTRPMVQVELGSTDLNLDPRATLGAVLTGLPQNGVVQLRVRGTLRADASALLSAPSLRSLAPMMNISVKTIE